MANIEIRLGDNDDTQARRKERATCSPNALTLYTD